MSQFIIEDIAGQVSAFDVTTSPILNNHSGIYTTATQNRGSFHYHLLVFFLKTTQLLSTLVRRLKIDTYVRVDVPQAGHSFSHACVSAFRCQGAWIGNCRKERSFSF